MSLFRPLLLKYPMVEPDSALAEQMSIVADGTHLARPMGVMSLAPRQANQRTKVRQIEKGKNRALHLLIDIEGSFSPVDLNPGHFGSHHGSAV